jgi:hypothetical protein
MSVVEYGAALVLVGLRTILRTFSVEASSGFVAPMFGVFRRRRVWGHLRRYNRIRRLQPLRPHPWPRGVPQLSRPVVFLRCPKH